MRKWWLGLGLLFVGVCGFCGYNLAVLFTHPNLHVPKRQYPQANAYADIRRMTKQIMQLSERDSRLNKILSRMRHSPASELSPAEESYLLKVFDPFLQQYPKFLEKPSVAVYEYSIDWRFPELAAMRDLMRAERFRVRRWLKANQDELAVQAFAHILHLSNQLRSEGPLMHHLAGYTLTQIALEPFWQDPKLLDTPRAMEQMIEAVRQFERHRPSLASAFQHELYFARALCNDLASGLYDIAYLSGEKQTPEPPSQFETIVLRVLVNLSVPEIEQYMAKAIAEMKKPYWERDKSRPPEPKQLISAILLPEFGRIGNREARELACLRLQATLCAIRLYKIRNGHYPRQLSDLELGDLVVDPFTGKPFRYRLDADKGFWLYSLGPNGTDENGMSDYRPAGEQGDIVPVIQKPPQIAVPQGQDLPLAPPFRFQ